jgi:hypothetical protein
MKRKSNSSKQQSRKRAQVHMQTKDIQPKLTQKSIQEAASLAQLDGKGAVVWTQQLHTFFPPDVRSRIKTLLLVQQRLRHTNTQSTTLATIPADLMTAIFQYVAAGTLYLHWPESELFCTDTHANISQQHP